MRWDAARFDLDRYIETHLAYELKYLLVAATTWSVVRSPDKRRGLPDHLVVMAMESAFVHARTLCEFLTLGQGWAKGRTPHRVPSLPIWDAYNGPLHMRVLHPDVRRPYTDSEPGGDLKERVVDLANEVLKAWREVSMQGEMVDHIDAMERARVSAISEAGRAARTLRSQPVFTT